MTQTIIHLGAHRTASTSIQRAMAREIDISAIEDVSLFDPEHGDDLLFRHIRNFSQKSVRDQAIAAQHLGELFGALTTGNQTVNRIIISHENLLGDIDDVIIRNNFYLNADCAVSELLTWLSSVTKIVICVRNYADFYASLYAYRVGINYEQPFSTYRSNLLSIERGWFDVVNDLRQCCDCPIIVCQFEHYIQNLDMMWDIFGFDAPTQTAFKHENNSIGSQGIHKLEKRVSKGGNLDKKTTLRFRNKFKSQSDPFQPWSNLERTQLNEKYEKDLKRIRDDLDVKLIAQPHIKKPL